MARREAICSASNGHGREAGRAGIPRDPLVAHNAQADSRTPELCQHSYGLRRDRARKVNDVALFLVAMSGDGSIGRKQPWPHAQIDGLASRGATYEQMFILCDGEKV